jgi:iron complex outermembrane receptor protein
LNDPFSALNLNNVPLLGALPFAALPASLAGCLLQKGFNPASTGGKVPVNLFGSSLGTSLPGPGSAPCPASPGGVNPFSLSSLPPFNNLIAISPAAYNLPNATESGILNGGKITYNARIAYEIQHNLNVYASYSTGWKAGSYNLSSDSTPATAAGVGRSARPENVEVYEVGLKAKFRNGYVNIALFDEVAKDFQTNTFIGTGYALLNAEKETIKGVEFDASYAPVKPLLLGFNLTYLDPKYNKYSQAGCFYYDTVRCPLDAQGNLPIFRDLSGTRPGGVPTWSITASALYTQDLGHGFSGYIRGEYDYSSRTTIGDGVPSTGAAATFGTYLVSQINGSIGLQTPFKLDVNLWVRNLTNQIYLISAFPTVLQSATPSSGDFIGSFSGYPSAPRTWGLTIRKAF